MKFSEDNMEEYTILKCEDEEPCMICKENTMYIDYCCEVRICSSECYYTLMKSISK